TAKEPLEDFARVVLHGQWRGRRPECNRTGVVATVVAIARAATARSFGSHLERWQRRLLPDVLRGDLIRCDTHVGLPSPLRVRAAQPRRRHDRVHRLALARAVAQAAEDRHLLLQRPQRLEYR